MEYFLFEGNELYSAYDPQLSVTIISIVPACMSVNLQTRIWSISFFGVVVSYPFDLAGTVSYH